MVSFLLENLSLTQSEQTSRGPTPASRTRTPASAGGRKLAGRKKEEKKEVVETSPSPGRGSPGGRWPWTNPGSSECWPESAECLLVVVFGPALVNKCC